MQFKSLKDHVYEYISLAITDGSLKANEKINEKEICKKLGVSSTPVKEALIQLETDGYLLRMPRKGFFVKELTLEKVKEKYIVIGALDGLAAVIALPNITDHDIKQMKDIAHNLDQSIKERAYKEYFKLQTEFHNIYMEKCHNEELTTLLIRMKRSFIKQTYYIDKSNDKLFEILQETNNEHKEIVTLFEKKDITNLESYIRNTHWSVKYADLDTLKSHKASN